MSTRRSNCRDCGASGNHVHISRAGLCPTCGERRLLGNIAQMQTQTGPAFDKWRQGMLEAGGFNGRPITPHAPDA